MFHAIWAVQNQTKTKLDVEVRQYLPLDDRVQTLDWYEVMDIDPIIASVQEVPYYRAGCRNRYLRFDLKGLGPGQVVQLGYIAGLHMSEDAGGHRRRRSLDPPAGTELRDPQALAMSDAGGCSQVTWADAVAATDAIPWKDIDVALQRTLAATASPYDFYDQLDHGACKYSDRDFLFQASHARRVALFVQAIIGNRWFYRLAQGVVPDPGVGGTGFGWIVPGSEYWPRLVKQRAEALAALYRNLLDPVQHGPYNYRFPELTVWHLVNLADLVIAPPATAAFPLEPWKSKGFAPAGSPAVPYQTAPMDWQPSCSPSSWLLMWFLRKAGIPCRELAGSLAPSTGYRETAPAKEMGHFDHTGHRTVEVWDGTLREWFVVDTTRAGMGPSLFDERRMAVATFRGNSGMHAPLAWRYNGLVWDAKVSPGEPRAGSPVPGATHAGFGRYYASLGSHGQSPSPIRPARAYETHAAALHDIDRALRNALGGSDATNFGIDDTYANTSPPPASLAPVDQASADALQAHTTVVTRAEVSALKAGIRAWRKCHKGPFPLAALDSTVFFPSVRPPVLSTPYVDPRSYVMAVMSLMSPNTMWDEGWWFLERYLLPRRALTVANPGPQDPCDVSHGQMATRDFCATLHCNWAWGLFAYHLYLRNRVQLPGPDWDRPAILAAYASGGGGFNEFAQLSALMSSPGDFLRDEIDSSEAGSNKGSSLDVNGDEIFFTP